MPADIVRFIPMYIGNTRAGKSRTWWRPVYPYVYREHLERVNGVLEAQRFIPMYIGNTYINR